MTRVQCPWGWLVAIALLSGCDTVKEEALPDTVQCLPEGGSQPCAYSFANSDEMKAQCINLSERYWMKYVLPQHQEACFRETLLVSSRPNDPGVGHLGPLPHIYPECFANGDNEIIPLQDSAGIEHFFKGDLLWADNRADHGLGVSHWPEDVPSLLAFSVHRLDDESLPTEAQIQHIRMALRAALPFSVDVAYFPMQTSAIEATTTWTGDIPVVSMPSLSDGFEVYNPGTAVGRLRVLTPEEFAEQDEDGTLGYQDILALWEAPEDMERMVGGIITNTRQGELSHLNLRAIARGTPNCYRESFDWLLDYQDLLVRVECTQEGLLIDWATMSEAEEYWASWKPDPVSIPTLDLTYNEMPTLDEIPVDTDTDWNESMRRFGAKATQLATIYKDLPAQYQLLGFAIPFRHYNEFMAQAGGAFDFGEGPQTLILQDALNTMLQDPTFQSNGSVRMDWLDQLRDAIEEAPVGEELLTEISEQIQTVFGDTTTMVRFRSSSNAEDDCRFSGAGLYKSTSVCLADGLDDDTEGPSHCDPEQEKERTVARGLRKVWGSLWKLGAYEERDWFGIDHSHVSMAILVNTRSQNEQANIVVFSGNPQIHDDYRYLVNAQAGELDVVSSAPGVYPESSYLTLSETGEVTLIERLRESSELPEGTPVLSDDRLSELGNVYWNILKNYPPPSHPPGFRLLTDTEWKILSDDRLIVKQLRPICINTSTESTLGVEWH